MTKSAVTTEAFTLGQQVAGLMLGVPFFLGSLFMLMAGQIAPHSKTWGEWAAGYLVFLVFPVAACLSSALAVFAAPSGQEKAYAKSPAIGYSVLLFCFALLFSSLVLYPAWPFASWQGVWVAFASSPLGPPIAMVLIALFLFPGAGAAGYAVGCSARNCSASVASRFLRLCWKKSRKSPLDTSIAPIS